MPKELYVGISLALVCLSLQVQTHAQTQNRELVVLGEITSDEIRRSAHRLGVSEEHMSNGLIALERGTALAMEVPPHQYFREIGRLWVNMDRKRAANVIADLIERLGPVAQQVEKRHEYEPPRDFRRLHFLRGWGHGKTKQILTRGQRTSSTDGVRA